MKNFYTTPLKKNVMELIKNIEIKGLKQNIKNLSIIEILKQSSLSLFLGTPGRLQDTMLFENIVWMAVFTSWMTSVLQNET